MARKITMNGQFRKPLEEVFEDYVISKIAQGVADVTVATYRHHIHSISNHLDIQKPMETFRFGGNGWFRACWVAPNPGNTEIICGCAILLIAEWFFITHL